MEIDWLAVSGLLVAIGALVQSRKALNQADEHMHQNQKHMQLSVVPHLKVHYIMKTNEIFSIHVESRGLGPAVISRWDIWCENDPNNRCSLESSTRLKEFFNAYIEMPEIPFVCASISRGSYLTAGSTWRLLDLDASVIRSEEISKVVQILLEQISVKVEYQSVYGKEFVELGSRVLDFNQDKANF